MKRYETERSFWTPVIPKKKLSLEKNKIKLGQRYNDESQFYVKDSERCASCRRVSEFTSSQMQKHNPRCIQCVVTDRVTEKKKKKKMKRKRDKSLRRDEDPFVSIRDSIRNRGKYALEDDDTLPGAIVDKKGVVSNVKSPYMIQQQQQHGSLNKKRRQAAEYARILEKREREKEQQRKRMEASRTNVACIYFVRGHCALGKECRYSHDITKATTTTTTITATSHIPCAFFRNGRCRRGQDCAFSHDMRFKYAESSEENVDAHDDENNKKQKSSNTFDMTCSFILECSNNI